MNRLNLIIRQKIFSIIFILISVLGGVFIYWYINNLKSKIPENMQYQEVFVAKNDIKKGEKISKDLLEKQKLPEHIFSEKFVLSEDQILGKEAASDILKGEIIYIDEIKGVNLSYAHNLKFSSYIPKNLRAVSVPINYFGDKVFNAVIRDNISLAEAPSFGKTIFEYKPESHGASDYLALSKEIVKRENR
jgi:Flp pilus assembly protein CpaB